MTWRLAAGGGVILEEMVKRASFWTFVIWIFKCDKRPIGFYWFLFYSPFTVVHLYFEA